MATNRKLGKTTDIRLAMLRTLTTDLILHGKIETTEARAKEVKAMADSIIALAVKEKDNFEEVEVKVSKAKLDAKGNKETELVKSKNGKEYLKVVKETTTEKRQKDMPSRLNARRKMMKTVLVIYIIVCVALIILATMQNSEKAGASGTITGSSTNNFYEQNKGRTKQGKLKRWTISLGIAFVVLALVLGILYLV